MKKIDEREIQQEAEAMVAKLNNMSVAELNEFYQKFKKSTSKVDSEIAEVQERISTAKEKMKDREQDDDTMYKIIFASCFASLVGGATLGGIFGDSMREFIGGAVIGSTYGTIFVSLLAFAIHQTKPVAKVVQSIKKFFLERKLDKLEERQAINKKIEAEISERI